MVLLVPTWGWCGTDAGTNIAPPSHTDAQSAGNENLVDTGESWAKAIADGALSGGRWQPNGRIARIVLYGTGKLPLDSEDVAWLTKATVKHEGGDAVVIQSPEGRRTAEEEHRHLLTDSVGEAIRILGEPKERLKNFEFELARLINRSLASDATERPTYRSIIGDLAPGLVLQQVAKACGKERLAGLALGEPRLLYRSDGGVTDLVPPVDTSIDWPSFHRSLAWLRTNNPLVAQLKETNSYLYKNIMQVTEWPGQPEAVYVWGWRDTDQIKFVARFLDAQGLACGSQTLYLPLKLKDTGNDTAVPDWFLPPGRDHGQAPVRYLAKELVKDSPVESAEEADVVAKRLARSTLMGATLEDILPDRPWVGYVPGALLTDLSRVWENRKAAWDVWTKWVELKEHGGILLFRPRDTIAAEENTVDPALERSVWRTVSAENGRLAYRQLRVMADAAGAAGFSAPTSKLASLLLRSQFNNDNTGYEVEVSELLSSGRLTEIAWNRLLAIVCSQGLDNSDGSPWTSWAGGTVPGATFVVDSDKRRCYNVTPEQRSKVWLPYLLRDSTVGLFKKELADPQLAGEMFQLGVQPFGHIHIRFPDGFSASVEYQDAIRWTADKVSLAGT